MARFEQLFTNLQKQLLRVGGALTVGAVLAGPGYAQNAPRSSQMATMVTELKSTLQNPGNLTLDQIADFYEQRGLPRATVEREIVNNLVHDLRDALRNPGDHSEAEIIEYFEQLGLDRAVIEQVVAVFHEQSQVPQIHEEPQDHTPGAGNSPIDAPTVSYNDPSPTLYTPGGDERDGGTVHVRRHTRRFSVPMIVPDSGYSYHGESQIETRRHGSWNSNNGQQTAWAPGAGSYAGPDTFSPRTSPSSSNDGTAGSRPAAGGAYPFSNNSRAGENSSAGTLFFPENRRPYTRYVADENAPRDGSAGYRNSSRTANGSDPASFANGSGQTSRRSYDANGNYVSNGSGQAGGRVNRAYGSDGSSRVIGQYDRNGNNQLNPPGGRINRAYGSDGSSRVIGQYDANGNNQLNSRASTNRASYDAPVTASQPAVTPAVNAQPASGGPTAPVMARRADRGLLQDGAANSSPNVTPTMPSVTPRTPGQSSDRAALNFN
jgi:hypothetical protein